MRNCFCYTERKPSEVEISVCLLLVLEKRCHHHFALLQFAVVVFPFPSLISILFLFSAASEENTSISHITERKKGNNYIKLKSLLVLVLSLWFAFLGVPEIKLLLAWKTKHKECLS